MPALPSLNLAILEAGMPALTPAMGRSLAEAAAVCLERAGHPRSPCLRVRSEGEREYSLMHPAVDDQMRRTYADPKEATAFGACGVSIAVIKEIVGFEVLERSWIGTGFDYWVGDDDEKLVFNSKTRLEVSGILQGNRAAVAERVRDKLRQVRASDDLRIPVIVSIIEFGEPGAEVVYR